LESCSCSHILKASIAIGVLIPVAAFGQSGEQAEVSIQESMPVFVLRAERNLVLVGAVVRDKSGRPVGNLKKQDFKLLDNGKPQTITHFFVQGLTSAPPALSAPGTPPLPAERQENRAAPPQRFLAILFDDTNTPFGDMGQVCQAAGHYLSTNFPAGERIGIFTISGHGEVGFTRDLEKLRKAVADLRSRPLTRSLVPCPDLTTYEANQIADHQDPFVLALGVYELQDCEQTAAKRTFLEQFIEVKAREMMDEAEVKARRTIDSVNRVVFELSSRAGELALLLVSPGFFYRTVWLLARRISSTTASGTSKGSSSRMR